MSRRDIKYLVTVILTFTALMTFTGGDCGTENEPPTVVAAPTNLGLSLDSNPGGNSFAVLSWNGSTDETDAPFRGYQVDTWTVNSDSTLGTLFNASPVQKSPRTYNVLNLVRGTRYISYVTSLLNDGTRSDSVATPVYSGIYTGNGIIDEFMQSGPAMSGFSWNTTSGAGEQLSYDQANASKIDIHMREDGGTLKFFSPHLNSPGVKTTLIRLLGSGESFYRDAGELPPPDLTSINVTADGVYLIRTAEDNYIKVWVKQINEKGDPRYSEAVFDFKLQPVTGLHVLKR